MGCGKKGHFKKKCKSGSKSNQSYRQNGSSRRVKEETSEKSLGSDDEDDYPTRLGKLQIRKTRAIFSQVEDVSRRREKVVDNASIQTESNDDEEEHKNEIKKIRVAKTSRNLESGIELPVTVNGVGFYVDPDTGADLNLFDESHYRMIKEKNPQTKLKKVKQKVIAANNTIVPIKAQFDATIYKKTRQIETEAFVMNGSLDGAPLSEATLLDLGCIKYDPEGKLQPPNRFPINHINIDDEDNLKLIVLAEPTNQEEREEFQEMRDLIKDKSKMFKGVGCFKKYQVHLELKEDAKPIIQKPRYQCQM